MAYMEETELTALAPQGTSSHFLVGVAVGAVIGTAVGLLFARKPGNEFRRDVADTANRLGRKASQAYGEAAHRVTDVVNRGRKAWDSNRQNMGTMNEGTPTPRTDGRTAAEGAM
jgi:gas vesicle protein